MPPKHADTQTIKIFANSLALIKTPVLNIVMMSIITLKKAPQINPINKPFLWYNLAAKYPDTNPSIPPQIMVIGWIQFIDKFECKINNDIRANKQNKTQFPTKIPIPAKTKNCFKFVIFNRNNPLINNLY